MNHYIEVSKHALLIDKKNTHRKTAISNIAPSKALNK